MARPPPILPITAVAIGGVLALTALSDAQLLPSALSRAKALAAGAAAPAPAPAAKPNGATAAPNAAKSPPPAAAPAAGPAPAPVCATSVSDLAKEAGLYPGEIQTLQNLQARRGQLDDREKQLETQLQLINTADAKLEARLKSLTALKAEIMGLMGQADEKTSAEIDRLVTVYSKMKPRDAAAIMATLDDKVRIPVAAKMKEKDLGAILALMPTSEAKKITESLASRFNSVKAINQALTNPPPEPAPTPDPPAKAPRKPARGRAAKPPAAAPSAG